MANLSNINNKFLVTTEGNVGINVTSPTAARLVVNTTSGVTAAFGRDGTDGDVVQVYNGLAGTTKVIALGASGNDGTIYSQYGDIILQPTAGKVGIGTDSPQYKTQITSTSSNNVTDILALHNGSNASGTGTGARLLFKLANFENAQEIRKYASIEGVSASSFNESIDLVFKTQPSAAAGNPVERLRITSGGNLLLGGSNDYSKISVSNGNSARTGITLSDGNTASLMLFAGNNLDAVISIDTQNLVFKTGSTAGIDNGTERMRITDYGSLVVNNTPGTNANWGRIQCGGTITVGNSSGTYNAHGRISGDSTSGLRLIGSKSGTYTATSGITIASSRIGINEIDPAALLHIKGTGDAIRVESTGTGFSGAQIDLLHFTTSPLTGDTFAMINMGGYYTGTTSVYGTSIKSIWTDVSARDAVLTFSTNNSGTLTERMRITSGGDTQLSGNNLDIKGTSAGNTSIRINDSTGTVGTNSLDLINDGTAAYIWNRANTNILFGINGTERMKIDNAGRIQSTSGIYLGSNNNANLLNYYEEGTWTPVIAHNDGTGVVPLSVSSARYIRVGQLVYVSAYLSSINPNGNAGGNGAYYGIRGFPFQPENYGAWQIVYASSGITTYGGYSSSASFYFMANGTNGQRSQAHVNGAQFNAYGSNLTLMMNCVYNIHG